MKDLILAIMNDKSTENTVPIVQEAKAEVYEGIILKRLSEYKRKKTRRYTQNELVMRARYYLKDMPELKPVLSFLNALKDEETNR